MAEKVNPFMEAEGHEAGVALVNTTQRATTNFKAACHEISCMATMWAQQDPRGSVRRGVHGDTEER